MISQNTQKLTSSIFSLKRIIFDQLKKTKAFDHKMHIQLETLFHISGHKNCRMKDIAGFLCITPPSATSMINALEKKGFIKRSNSPVDRRAITLSLTPKGHSHIKKARELIENKMAEIFSPLNNSEQQSLINIYKKLVNFHKK